MSSRMGSWVFVQLQCRTRMELPRDCSRDHLCCNGRCRESDDLRMAMRQCNAVSKEAASQSAGEETSKQSSTLINQSGEMASRDTMRPFDYYCIFASPRFPLPCRSLDAKKLKSSRESSNCRISASPGRCERRHHGVMSVQSRHRGTTSASDGSIFIQCFLGFAPKPQIFSPAAVLGPWEGITKSKQEEHGPAARDGDARSSVRLMAGWDGLVFACMQMVVVELFINRLSRSKRLCALVRAWPDPTLISLRGDMGMGVS